MSMRCNGIDHRTASPERGSRVGASPIAQLKAQSSTAGGAPSEQCPLTQQVARRISRRSARRTCPDGDGVADNEEVGNRGRWGFARCIQQ